MAFRASFYANIGGIMDALTWTSDAVAYGETARLDYLFALECVANLLEDHARARRDAIEAQREASRATRDAYHEGRFEGRAEFSDY